MFCLKNLYLTKMESINVRFLKDKPQLVDVEASVQQIKDKLKDHKELELVAKQGEINRVGMIIKRIEEDTKSKIKSMKTVTQKETIKDDRGDDK